MKRHLKQTATLRRYVDFDDNGEPVYSPPIEQPPLAVKVRKVPGFGSTVNELGVEVPNRTKLLMSDEVAVRDLVDDAPVEGVEAIVNKRGKTIGYRVEL
ncbi:hypothetical protein GBA65_14925 [Rubrobacter marinus]|uniref:Uncharacterized protein n=1 Tax=Rubrobacter marinus TaxID=2653852 RepID=A0A6G8PZJ4_9ACTN|nr:hypothetical protein [Rubrobacter marinus]QIN79600.1 hypothetical protein GBA65_14925 [Rubrobacter marinus]